VHYHLSVVNLLKYAQSRKGKSEAGTRTNLSILHRYFTINGIQFDELEYNAVKHKIIYEQNDKPLELETLQKMMDLADSHGKAFLTFLVSTGCRAGECCEILLSDLQGDIVTIRNEVAKGKRGGKVYLTSEAREYLDLWLKERDHYIKTSDARMKPLKKYGAHARPVKDERLFACSYTSLHRVFSRLYGMVDGEQGKYRAKCTPHSTRKYFRTHAVKSMSLDLVEGLMRHTGYLNSHYVRMTDEERRREFHAGESALYITRYDHRITTHALSTLQDRIVALEEALGQAYEQAKPGESILIPIPKSQVIE
jgi:integrase